MMRVHVSQNQLLTVASLALLLATSLGRLHAQIEPSARALAEAVEAKLGAAQTILLTARHRMDPDLGVGSQLENGPMHFTVERPNRFHVLQPAGNETREIAYDGTTFLLMQPGLKHYAQQKLPAESISEFADLADARFGFRPPVAELLSADFSRQLFRNVTSAKLLPRERIGFTTCERLQVIQPGLQGDLWIGVKSGLPLRYRLTFIDLPGQPTRVIDLKRWELNQPVDRSLFSKRPAPESFEVPMVKSR